MSLNDRALAALASLAAENQLRSPRHVSGPQGPRFVADGRHVLCFCSNDYLGLASHPALRHAVRSALDDEGVGAGASRHVSGNMARHRSLEADFAAFTGHDSAVLFSTGYAANVGVLQALANQGDIIFSDALNHASIIDGARLSRAQVVVYRHADPQDLAKQLAAHRHEGRNAVLVTETLFSMDGDEAPLPALSELALRYDLALVVDDAHALGVLGPGGRGLACAPGFRPDVTIGTLGKAFGCQGAFAATSTAVADLIRNRARSFIYSTAPSPALTAAALAALRLVREADAPRQTLRRHWTRLRHGLSELGYRAAPGDSPIIPVLIGDARSTMALSEALFERGVFIHGIRPPTVPRGESRLRVVPMATHTEADIAEALSAFAEASR